MGVPVLTPRSVYKVVISGLATSGLATIRPEHSFTTCPLLLDAAGPNLDPSSALLGASLRHLPCRRNAFNPEAVRIALRDR